MTGLRFLGYAEAHGHEASRFAITAEVELNEAVGDYLEVQHWQLKGIDQAIAEADAGHFASDEEVKAVFAAFKTPLSS